MHRISTRSLSQTWASSKAPETSLQQYGYNLQNHLEQQDIAMHHRHAVAVADTYQISTADRFLRGKRLISFMRQTRRQWYCLVLTV